MPAPLLSEEERNHRKMNPGPVEEVGKAAGTFMDIMRAQPLSLALVLMNLALLAVFWFILSRIDEHNKTRETQMFEEQRHVRELLSACVVPK